MIYHSLIVPFLLLLSLTDTCDAESMFSRRDK